MVGNGIGACFLDAEANIIADSSCSDLILSNDEFTDAETLGVIFYPNPVTGGRLNIISDVESFDTMSIYILLGGKIYKGKFRESINTSRLSPGI